MPLTDARIIESLPLLQWRGLTSPLYDVLTVEWDNGLAPRSIPYVPGEMHDNVGRRSFPLGVRLYFVNTLNQSPPEGVARYFPEYWNLWQAQLLDGDAGDLVHPVLGPIRARVKGGKYDVRAQVASGIIVDVTFVETVEDPADINLNGYTNTTLPTQALAEQADDAVEPFGITFASNRPLASISAQYGVVFAPDDTFATISAVFNAILGPISLGGFGSLSLLQAFQGDLAVMIDLLSARNDVQTYVAADALIAFWLACDDMRLGLSLSARQTAVYVAQNRTTLDAVAAMGKFKGNSLKDLMGLNLRLLIKPSIEPGTPITYYVAT